MSYFKVHQIWFQLGRLCPRPHWGTLQHSSDLRRFSGDLLLRRGKRREGRNKEKWGCTVQGRICDCYGNTVVTEI